MRRKEEEPKLPSAEDVVESLTGAMNQVFEGIGEKAKAQAEALDASRQLKKELENTEKEEQRAARRYDFASSKLRASPISPALERITTTILVSDPEKEFAEIDTFLKGIGPNRKNHATLARYLDQAEGYVRRAHKLLVTVILAREEWEHQNRVVFAAMRDDALRELQEQKDKGKRSKQITDADVDHQVAKIYPEDHQHQELKRRRLKLLVDDVQNMVEACLKRCGSLQTMLGKSR